MSTPPSTPRDDAALALRARVGDREAFAVLVQRYHVLVCAIVYGVTGDRARTEDLAQDSFVQAWRHGSSLNDPSKWRAWVCRIAHNRALQCARATARDPLEHGVTLDRAVDVTDSELLPSDRAVRHEEHSMLHRALAALPEQYRLPVILYYWEDMDLQRVAEQLDVSYDTARQRLVRARTMLRDQLATALERDLRDTKPDRKFTAAVMAALPGLLRPVQQPGTTPGPGTVLRFGVWAKTGIAGGLAAATIVLAALWPSVQDDRRHALAPVAAGVRDAIVATDAIVAPEVESPTVARAANAPVPAPVAAVSPLERIRKAAVTHPSGMIYGQALFLDNEPAPGSTVEAISLEPLHNPCATAVADDDGRWDMVVPEGEYCMRAHAPDFAGCDFSCDNILVVQRDNAVYEEMRLVPAIDVRGRVLDEVTGEALAGAAICVSHGYTTTTDAHGNFAVDDVYPASNEVRATKAGWYIPPAYFAAGRTMKADLLLKAQRGSTISGRVVDAAGYPVQDVEIRFAGREVWFPDYGLARTDSAGAFRVDSLPRTKRLYPEIRGCGYTLARPVKLSIPSSGLLDDVILEARVELSAVLADRWNIEMPGPSRMFFLNAEAAESVSAFYEPEPAIEARSPGGVGGTVLNELHQAQPNQLVRYGDRRTTTDENGRFYFDDVSGAVAEVRVFGRGMMQPGGQYFELACGRSDHELVVTTPESHVAGTVLWLEDGSPVTHFAISLASPSDYDYRNRDFSYSGSVHQVYSEDGTFCLRGLQGAGDARLFVEADGYMESVQDRARMSSAPQIDYGHNTVYISRRNGAVTAKGFVVDARTGTPIADATVHLGDVPVDPTQGFSPWSGCVTGRPRLRKTTTDENGAFRFERVPSHQGELIIESEGHGRRWLRCANFDIPQRIKLDPASSIQGTLSAEHMQEESPGANLRYYEGNNYQWHEYVPAAADGTFRFTNLSPGRYRVTFGLGGAKMWITLSPGEARTLETPES